MKTDYLIVGQGLAGTCLAWNLYFNNKKFLLVNDGSLPSSSLVAAGIFNPLTGRKLAKTWFADVIFPHASEFYTRIEEILECRLVHQADVFRPFRSVEEQNDYLAIAAEKENAGYVASNTDFSAYSTYINAPYGGLEVTGSGWVDLPLFISRSRSFFFEMGFFEESRIELDELLFVENGVVWRNREFEQAVLCQGMQALANPLFSWLAFNPVKGQILDLEIDDYPIGNIVNQGVFLLKHPDGKVRLGATYSWHDIDWEISQDGRKWLEDKVADLLLVEYKVVGQRAGIRPSVKDRRPLLGRHPEYHQLLIFNGLGTKGVTLAPYFAAELTNHLLFDKEIDNQVNITRYFSLYYQA